MQRFGQLIRLKPEMQQKYFDLHANIWPAVSKTITECNIQNYSIYYHDGMLFSYYEYVGDDYEADMEKMAQDPATQDWWDVCKPCQTPLPERAEGEWWLTMTECFHQD